MTRSNSIGHLRIRRIGWLAALGTCIALYTLLHVKVNAVHAEVIRAEREIVRLEEQNMLLETEFLTRSNQVQLSAWNRVDFGFEAPRAEQFIENPVQLASFGMPRRADAPAPIRLAKMTAGEDVPDFPQLTSPLTGEPVDERVLAGDEPSETRLAVALATGTLRVPIVSASDIAGGTAVAVAEAAVR
ncbi:hypothetical protein [Aurantiacibacter poecillastricola]|uniref:hypothetical protein n=1 Tax=Aurantiacibacter poecillastricola TaxID=3064385 RepID=UPI00273F247C|nr:hypothetical protein [Aurantiacibacter sp. 219JJ12-13]MDP5262878.1 hypothetical protein [Aurantiacibacter sp. 219JJ12-13]